MGSKEQLEALFQYANEGILIVDESGKILRVNPSAERIFGYSTGELNGQQVEVLLPDNLAMQHHHHRFAFHQAPRARAMGAGFDLRGKRKDGSEFPLEISLSPYSSENGNFIIAFIIDITIRKQAEDKIRNYSTELERQVESRTLILHEAIAELEKTKSELHEALNVERELNDMKSRFVSMASHEFRTPLTAILSSVSLASKYASLHDLENHEKHIHRIKTTIHNLTEILNDILSITKLEEGKISANPEPIELQEFLAGIREEMQMTVREGQVIHYSHEGSSQALRVDKKILKNILLNLLSNAIKFSPENSSILIHSLIRGNMCEISVKDSGMGISKQDQGHLFERFFRGANATHIQGTGLGLNIVLKYTELINGTISFQSKENEGTTFTLHVKLS